MGGVGSLGDKSTGLWSYMFTSILQIVTFQAYNELVKENYGNYCQIIS